MLQRVLDDIGSVANLDPDLSDEDDQKDHTSESIQRCISELKREITKDLAIDSLTHDGHEDIDTYNAELSTLGDPSWLNAPWLYAECHMYRLLLTILRQHQDPRWNHYDPFWTSKRDAIISSQKGVVELIKRFNSILTTIEQDQATPATDSNTELALFEEMVQIALWGNATDLSLLQSVSIDQLDSLQGQRAREASKANVLVDDTASVFSLLKTLRETAKAGEIHYVLDNAGFELLTDLVFASFLLATGYTSKIVLHGKRIPWFVSDVNAHDLSDLVSGLQHSSYYAQIEPSDDAALRSAAEHIIGLQKAGKLTFEADPFWTTSHPFGRMKVVAPELYQQLEKADLVIYKGDLNYRKLTYDGMWEKTTPFQEAIGPLRDGTRTFALRTCKADVAVGIPAEKLEGLPDDWTYSGKWGLVQYWDGKA